MGNVVDSSDSLTLFSSTSFNFSFSMFSTVRDRVSLRVSRIEANIDFSSWFLLPGLAGLGWGIFLHVDDQGRQCWWTVTWACGYARPQWLVQRPLARPGGEDQSGIEEESNAPH